MLFDEIWNSPDFDTPLVGYCLTRLDSFNLEGIPIFNICAIYKQVQGLFSVFEFPK
jgi:hypothetical protein